MAAKGSKKTATGTSSESSSDKDATDKTPASDKSASTTPKKSTGKNH